MIRRSSVLALFVIVFLVLSLTPNLRAERPRSDSREDRSDRRDDRRDRSSSDSPLVIATKGLRVELIRAEVLSFDDVDIQDLVNRVIVLLDSMEMSTDDLAIPERIFGVHVALNIASHLLHKYKSPSAARRIAVYAHDTYVDWDTFSGDRMAFALEARIDLLATLEDGTFPPEM